MKFRFYVESKELPHLYPLVQNMVARAIASILVGLKLCKDKELLETFKNVAVDIGSELNPDNYLYEAFPTISRLRQWYLGKYGKAINKHQEHMLRVLGPEIDERLAAMERGDDEWERPVSYGDDVLIQHTCLTQRQQSFRRTSCKEFSKPPSSPRIIHNAT